MSQSTAPSAQRSAAGPIARRGVGLFGGHVAGRADHQSRSASGHRRAFVLQPLGQPEVGDLGDQCGKRGARAPCRDRTGDRVSSGGDRSLDCQEDITGFQVAMNDPGSMRRVDRFGQGHEQLGGPRAAATAVPWR